MDIFFAHVLQRKLNIIIICARFAHGVMILEFILYALDNYADGSMLEVEGGKLVWLSHKLYSGCCVKRL